MPRLVLAFALTLWSVGSFAQEVVACRTLVALRLLSAAVDGDRGAAARRVAEQPDCTLVPRGDVGAVRHRAMVGGAPYECLDLRAGDCLWVLP